MALDLAGQYQYPDPDPAWLALHTEAALDPTLPIVDAHHHLWDESGKRYFIDELQADMATGHNIVATVFVQCHYGYLESGPEHLRCIGETEKIEAMRRSCEAGPQGPGPCAAIVGFADLMRGEAIDEVLDAHLAASPGHFRGIRQSFSRDSHFPQGIVLRPAPEGMSAAPRFRQALRRIARRNLSFDAMFYHQQIPEAIAMARDIDEATIIVDHFATPLGVGHYRGREQETLGAWRTGMRELAACPNVNVKLGGLGMLITGAEWHLADTPPTSLQLAAAWQPYFDVCIESFGTGRCLFESNFPVDRAMYSYAVLWNAFKRLASGASATETADLFRNTAARLYRLEFNAA